MKTETQVMIFVVFFALFLLSFPIMGIYFSIQEEKVIEKNMYFCTDKDYIGYVNNGAVFYCYKYDNEGFIIKSKERVWYNE